MLPGLSLPASLGLLLDAFRGCFTAPSFRVFAGLVAGHVGRVGRRSVCGMLVGAGLSRSWPHDRAHRFFSGGCWSADRVGLTAARLIVSMLVPVDAPIVVAVDDSLFKRSGRKVYGACWQHDGSSPAARRRSVGFGNGWVVLAVIVWLPFVTRPVALPVLARLWRPRTGPTQVQLAVDLVALVTTAVPGRVVHVLGDAGYRGPALRRLPAGVEWTCRLQRNAVLHQLPGPRVRKPGRPKLKGERIGTPAELAAAAAWTPAQVSCYGRTDTVHLGERVCLWYGVLHARPVRVVLVRDAASSGGYDLALVTTDLHTTADQLISRYAARWAIEVAFYDAKQTLGVGQARNRTQAAVERTVPFGLITLSLVVTWYAVAGHHPGDAADHRRNAPWYHTKTEPSFEDMIIKLRRVLIAARITGTSHHDLTHEEIHHLHLAWAQTTA